MRGECVEREGERRIWGERGREENMERERVRGEYGEREGERRMCGERG